VRLKRIGYVPGLRTFFGEPNAEEGQKGKMSSIGSSGLSRLKVFEKRKKTFLLNYFTPSRGGGKGGPKIVFGRKKKVYLYGEAFGKVG